jgi:hypothetical protein
MPTKEEILGFANLWCRMGMTTAHMLTLHRGVPIRVLREPEFMATKLEVFLWPRRQIKVVQPRYGRDHQRD